MAFPTNPTNGQTATVNGIIYTYSTALGAWQITTTTGTDFNANVIAATANITGGNILTTGIVSATGTITGGNLSTGGTLNVGALTATGTVTGGNITTGGSVSATGNVTGGNLLTSGKVGIGTTSLLSWGNLVVQTSTSSNTPILAITDNSLSPQLNHYITDSGSTVRNLNQIGFNTGNSSSSAYQGYITFSTMASAGGTISERMRILANGNVGIATTTPGNILDVTGNVYVSGNVTGGNFISGVTNNVLVMSYDTVGGQANIGANSTGGSTSLYFGTSNAGTYATRVQINNIGNILPTANATQDLGSTTLRWKNIYTSDLDLNNGIGDWTLVEGEDDLFVYNNRRGKTYKLALIEVDPAQAPPKINDIRR